MRPQSLLPYRQDTICAAWVAAVPFLLESDDNMPSSTEGSRVRRRREVVEYHP
jgi:hypothetical protein